MIFRNGLITAIIKEGIVLIWKRCGQIWYKLFWDLKLLIHFLDHCPLKREKNGCMNFFIV